jgi:hypothetical protein
MTKLIVQPAAWRFFKKVRDAKLQALFRDTLATILEDPEIGTTKTADLKGIRCVDVFYAKTNYEVAYRIEHSPDDEPVVVVILAGTRENFYKELRRYW